MNKDDSVILVKHSSAISPKKYVGSEIEKEIAEFSGNEALSFMITPVKADAELDVVLNRLADVAACKECNGVNLISSDFEQVAAAKLSKRTAR